MYLYDRIKSHNYYEISSGNLYVVARYHNYANNKVILEAMYFAM